MLLLLSPPRGRQDYKEESVRNQKRRVSSSSSSSSSCCHRVILSCERHTSPCFFSPSRGPSSSSSRCLLARRELRLLWLSGRFSSSFLSSPGLFFCTRCAVCLSTVLWFSPVRLPDSREQPSSAQQAEASSLSIPALVVLLLLLHTRGPVVVAVEADLLGACGVWFCTFHEGPEIHEKSVPTIPGKRKS